MSLKLSDFETIRELGNGAFATVRLARKKDQGTTFAIKTVSLTKLSLKERDNALNEIPNVIAYKAAFFDQDSASLCICMEVADRGDLYSKVQALRQEEPQEGFQEQFIWKVAFDVLQGLKALHSHHIIHRDIKSGNVLFVGGVAKLGDLNVSKVAEQGLCETQTGTPYYTSPEIWQGQKYGSKCDIWSLGVVLYEMCTLKMPFTGPDFPSLFRRVTEGNYEPLPSAYSAQLHNLVRMCLTLEEEMRPSASELLDSAVLREMEPSREGGIQLIQPIKCPKVLRFLAIKLPKPRFEDQKAGFNRTLKKVPEDSFKIKTLRKIRSEKTIPLEESRIGSPKKGSLKPLEDCEGGSKRKASLRKNLWCPRLESEAKVLLPPIPNKEDDKKAPKQMRKVMRSPELKVGTSAHRIALEKQN